MNRNAQCAKDLSSVIRKAIQGLRNSLNGIDSRVSKQVLDEHIGLINTSLHKSQATLTSGKSTLDLVAEVDSINKMLKRDINDMVGTYKKALALIEDFDAQIGKSKDFKTIEGSLKSQFEKTHNLIRGEKVWFDNLVENAFDRLETQGARSNPEVNLIAKNLFEDLVAGGRKLERMLTKQGVEDVDKTIFMALHQGTSKIPELDRIAAIFKEIDGVTIKRAQGRSPELGNLKDHVLALQRDPIKLKTAGLEKFKAFIEEHADLEKLTGGRQDSADAVAETIEEMFSESVNLLNRDLGRGAIRSNFYNRVLSFKDVEAEYAFLKEFGKMDSGIVGGFLTHRKGLLQKATINRHYGTDADLSLAALKDHILKSYGKKDVTNNDKLNTIFNRAKANLDTAIGQRSELSDTTQHLLRAFSQSVSASLTGLSTVRNIAYDLTIHSGIVQSLTTGQNGILTGVAKSAWGLARHMIQHRRSDELAKLFQDQGIAIKVSQSVISQGILKDAAALGSTGNKVAKKLDDVTAKWIEGVSKYGMADLTNQASRAYHTTQTSRLMLRHMDNGFENINDVLKSSLRQNGINEAEFELLSRMERIKFEGQDIAVNINYKPGDEGKYITSIDAARRTAETDQDVMQRVTAAYTAFMSEKVNEIASIPTARGQLVHGKESNGWISLVNTGAVKFSNIALSQWYGLYRNMHRAAGLNPNIVGTFSWRELALVKKNPVMVAKVLTGMAAGGIAGIWIKDLLSGNTPRDVTPEVMFSALSQNGFGGIVSLLANTLYFDDDIVATPASAFVRTGKQVGKAVAEGDARKIGGAAQESAKRFVPGADMWYTRAATKAMFRHGFGVHKTQAQARALRKRGQEEWID